MGKRSALPETWAEVLYQLYKRKGQWVLVTNYGTYSTVWYLRTIGARVMREPYAMSPSGTFLETVYAQIPGDHT